MIAAADVVVMRSVLDMRLLCNLFRVGGMMGPGMMGMWMPWFGYTFSAIGLVSGLVLVGGLMLQSRPDQVQTWGVLILVFAVVSFFSMGGFLIGAILGIVAGILALTWRPAQR
jgi:hypothetical protein